MIRSFRSRALKRYWERGDTARLPPQDLARIRRILDLLDAAGTPEELAIPSFRFHRLRGEMSGRYAVTVRANWRITFGWDDTDATDVDFEDYH